jgi:hypothetical protein
MLQVSRAELLPHARRTAPPGTRVVAQGAAAGALLIAFSIFFLPV